MVQSNDQFEEFLSRGRHANPDLHRFGDTFLIPAKPTASLPGDSGSPGESDTPARADHRHEREAPTAEDPTPVGVVSMFAGNTPPTGWLECDGSAISRTVYTDLFTRIGTAYGIGDGTNTFNLPNLQDAFPIGRSGTLPRGTTGGADSDSHDHSGVTGAPDMTVEVQSGTGTVVATDTHTHTIDTHITPTLPPFQAIVFIIKAES